MIGAGWSEWRYEDGIGGKFPEAQLLARVDVLGGSIPVESRLTGFRIF